jgi:glucose/arabinose dehydrogenase
MRWWRHILPILAIIVLLLFARQIYPYTTPLNNVNIYGFEIEKVASGLGGPTCIEWVSSEELLICDRDGDRILLMNISDDFDYQVIIDGLNNPHDVHFDGDVLFVSEAGKLSKYNISSDWQVGEKIVLIEDIPVGNHQTNGINAMPNGTLIWHSGSTCNICLEDDSRNGALLWVNGQTGDHGILASGVRNSFDGVWVDSMGYLFTDNGRDWEGDHPPEEVNLLTAGADYGWPNDEPEDPVPSGTIGPIAKWAPHTSMCGIDVRPENSSLPGLSIGAGHTVYASVYGSWNTLLPQGHEIVRIDFTPEFDEEGNFSGWDADETRIATQLGTPLPLRFSPSGDLYYATFGGGGTLNRFVQL